MLAQQAWDARDAVRRRHRANYDQIEELREQMIAERSERHQRVMQRNVYRDEGAERAAQGQDQDQAEVQEEPHSASFFRR